MVADSWFRSLWKNPQKRDSGPQKAMIGVLAFEVAGLMSKLVHLWQSLSDKEVARLREEIMNSTGVKKLVSDDDDFIVRLISAEMIECMEHVAKSVARLGSKCSDPVLKKFKPLFDELINSGADPYGWVFSRKKMDKKAKKMEHFISVNASLYQEMEMLADHEQTVRRMKGNDPEPENLLDYQKKLVWKRHEVKNLRDISLWNRSYDYTIRLLARSLFTIYSRINNVFGISPTVYSGDSKIQDSDYIYRSQSVSAVLHSSFHSPENDNLSRFSSGPLGNYAMNSGPMSGSRKANTFFSGPLGSSNTKSSQLSGKRRNNMKFFSGSLGKATSKSGPISGLMNKSGKMPWQTPQSHALSGKKPPLKPNRLTQVGPFKGCMVASNSEPVANCYVSSADIHSGILERTKESTSNSHPTPSTQDRTKPPIISPCRKLLDAPSETLGAAALALHYANVIVVIEKLAASPHLISDDAKDDLYNMLPANVRAGLRAKLRPFSKSLGASICDPTLAGEWSDAMATMLEWLAPLAHNMIRWQSERSFEQQNFGFRTNVLLVQTLYFANQEKTEATITELLVGLNYISRFGRDLKAKA